ncbi:MAG: hypothetical protein ACRD10_03795, partial [Terriglobia bacterium]
SILPTCKMDAHFRSWISLFVSPGSEWTAASHRTPGASQGLSLAAYPSQCNDGKRGPCERPRRGEVENGPFTI